MKVCRYGLIERKFFYAIPHFLHGLEVTGLEAAHARAGDGGNLFVGEVFIITHYKDAALLVGKGGNDLGEFPLGRIPAKPWVGVYHPFGTRVKVFELKGRPYSAAAKVTESFVGGYAPYPCEVAGIATEGRKCFPDFEESLLHQVVRILMAVHEAAYMPVQAVAVLRNKLPEYAFQILHIPGVTT